MSHGIRDPQKDDDTAVNFHECLQAALAKLGLTIEGLSNATLDDLCDTYINGWDDTVQIAVEKLGGWE